MPPHITKTSEEKYISLIPQHYYKLNFMTLKELNRLKLLLVEKKKTGLWLAEQLGKDKTTISKWCTNSSQPDVECLIKISKLLNVELSDILIVDNEEI